jgi:putative flippase GtrA
VTEEKQSLSENEEQKPKRNFSKFLLVSCITGTVGLGSFALLVSAFENIQNIINYDVGIVIAEYLSVIWSCTCSFVLNSKFTFKGRKARRMGIFLYLAFYFITTPLGSWMIVALNNAGVYIIFCKIIKMTINVVLDYLYCRYFIFAVIKKRYDETPIPESTPNFDLKKN